MPQASIIETNGKMRLLSAFGPLKVEAAKGGCRISFAREDEDGDKEVKVLDLDLCEKFEAEARRLHQQNKSVTRPVYERFEGKDQTLRAEGANFTDALDAVFTMATKPGSVVEVAVSGGGGLMGEWTERKYFAYNPQAQKWTVTKARPKTPAPPAAA